MSVKLKQLDFLLHLSLCFMLIFPSSPLRLSRILVSTNILASLETSGRSTSSTSRFTFWNDLIMFWTYDAEKVILEKYFSREEIISRRIYFSKLRGNHWFKIVLQKRYKVKWISGSKLLRDSLTLEQEIQLDCTINELLILYYGCTTNHQQCN